MISLQFFQMPPSLVMSSSVKQGEVSKRRRAKSGQKEDGREEEGMGRGMTSLKKIEKIVENMKVSTRNFGSQWRRGTA